MSKYKIVMIEWIDAQSVDMGGCFTEKDLENLEPVKAYIVGWLVKEDKDNYFIAKESWESREDYFKYLHIIPKRSVTWIDELFLRKWLKK